MTEELDKKIVARFIYQSSKYKKSDNSLRYTAMMPRKDPEDVSLFDVDSLTDNEICIHGRSYADNNDKNYYHKGFGKQKLSVILKTEVDICFDDNPPRHINLYYPEGLTPDKKRLIAEKLAYKSTFIECKKSKK